MSDMHFENTTRLNGYGLIALALCALVMAPTVAYGEITRRVSIENQTGVDVTGVFASGKNVKQWGPNRLRSNLQRGYQVELDLSDGTGACNLDVLIVRSDRRQMQGAYNVCETPRIIISQSNSNLPVSFINRSSGSIRYLYVGGNGWWSDDLLGPGISLDAEETLQRNIKSTTGCMFNIRAVWWDESDLVLENVDLCSNRNAEIARPRR